MRGMVPPDPETNVSEIHYAVVYVPKRNRKRFAANCVDVKETLEETLKAADPENNYYAAQVIGPSKSSEGQYLYYLSQWL